MIRSSAASNIAPIQWPRRLLMKMNETIRTPRKKAMDRKAGLANLCRELTGAVLDTF